MDIACDSTHLYKQYVTNPSPGYKLIITLQDPFPYDVSFDNAVQ